MKQMDIDMLMARPLPDFQAEALEQLQDAIQLPSHSNPSKDSES